MLKEIIKKILPQKFVDQVIKYRNRKRKLFMDRDFLSYVKRKKIGFEKNLETMEILALRGSHADYGILTDHEKSLYNLGLTSTDIYFNYKLYEAYSQKMTNLNSVIFFYSVFTPGLSLIKISEKYRLVAYKKYFGVAYQEEGVLDCKLEAKILKECNKIKKINVREDYRGYENNHHFITDIPVEKRAKIHLRENIRKPDQLIWLEKLVESVTRDNRKLYIVIPPAQKAYVNSLPHKSELFLGAYNFQSENVCIMDFYDSPIFEDSDLGDYDHLNEKGAFKLTSEVLRRIENAR
ncbi:hypothetical protein [Photobacterium indicum]|uniref:SGNH/GDSL hydrolase family protein n=1 Tax=Photobacterium indicum TaxID=81447 RepID=A0A2T3L7X6_9GAMM|nr:hypothetical protein [Photobacterium indicum]PSV46787.1 hypothetical protein C9J47_13425 [Photobacterium indicum]